MPGWSLRPNYFEGRGQEKSVPMSQLPHWLDPYASMRMSYHFLMVYRKFHNLCSQQSLARRDFRTFSIESGNRIAVATAIRPNAARLYSFHSAAQSAAGKFWDLDTQNTVISLKMRNPGCQELG